VIAPLGRVLHDRPMRHLGDAISQFDFAQIQSRITNYPMQLRNYPMQLRD
jgi:hypothetical protein